MTIGCRVSGRGSKGFSPCAINDSVNGSSSGFSDPGSKGSSSSSSGSCSISSCCSFGSSTSVKTSSEVPEFDSGSECSPNVPLHLGGVLSYFCGVGCLGYQHDVQCFWVNPIARFAGTRRDSLHSGSLVIPCVSFVSRFKSSRVYHG